MVREDSGNANVSTAKVNVESAYDLAQFFRGIARISGVPDYELFGMRSMLMHHQGHALVDGHPLPAVWYKTELPGAPGLRWVLYEAESLFGYRAQYQPYDGATLDVVPGMIVPQGISMRVPGWTVTVTMTMAPDTTLATIERHRQLLVQCAAVRSRVFDVDDTTGLLCTAPQPHTV